MLVTPDDIITAIERMTLGGRSLQKVIGPSEVGITCDRCLARKLAETEKGDVISSFRTTIGRGFHALAEQEVPPQFPDGAVVAENHLFIHQYKTLTLAGSSDVFLPNNSHGMVLDYKCVGDDTLEKMRRDVASGAPLKPQYSIQGNLYGLGWELLGYPVEDICILFVPANKGDLRKYHVKYQYRYDRTEAAKALAKIEALIDRAEVEGWPRVIRTSVEERGCLSCPQYALVDNPQHDFFSGFPEKLANRKR